MEKNKFASLPPTFLAIAVLLSGCVGIDPEIEADEWMTQSDEQTEEWVTDVEFEAEELMAGPEGSEELIAVPEDSYEAPEITELDTTVMPAFAQPAFTYDYDIYTAGGAGAAYWEDYGEHVYLCDRSKDGYRVVLFYYTSDDGTLREAHNANGVNTCGDLNLEISESGYIMMNVCLQNGASGNPFSCSGWYLLYAS